jgi:hypothetical protein
LDSTKGATSDGGSNKSSIVPSTVKIDLAVGTVVNQVAGLRSFFRRVLKRRFPPASIP